MSILTGRELEFLASLNTSWRRLYWNELVRLLKEDDNRCDPWHETDSNRSAIRILESHHSEPGGQILTFAPEYRKCDQDLKRQDAP